MVTKTTPPPAEATQPAAVHHLKLNSRWDRYSESVQAAAGAGKISNAKPLIGALNADMRVFSGLAVLIEIVRNNAMLQDEFDPDDANTLEPLGDNSVDALLNLASEICHARSEGICFLADWVEKHIDSKEGK